jgi:hypothetical protein
MLHADTAWLLGEVAAVSIENGRAVAELKVRCENQRGERIASGTAKVELPSRNFAVTQPGLKVPEWLKAKD